MKVKNVFEYQGRTFEVITTAEFQGEMAVCSIYEIVRPNWKIFRKRWLDTRSFWIDTFPTIEDGVKCMVENAIDQEDKDNGVQAKWNEFSKKNT